MEVAEKEYQFGQLLKKSELTNLSLIVITNAVEVIALVNDEQSKMWVKSPSGSRL